MKPIKNIAILFLLIIIVPMLFFTFFELNSLKSSEKVIERIYKSQIDNLFNSINDYSNNVVRDWEQSITKIFNDSKNISEDFAELKRFNPSISEIFFYKIDTLSYKLDAIIKSSNSELISRISKNPDLIKRLLTYKKIGYTKIENVDSLYSSYEVTHIFIEKKDINYFLGGLRIDPEHFIRNILSVKMQNILQNEFNFISYSKSGKIIYANDRITQDEAEYSENLSLFTNYSIGLKIKGETISDVIKARTYTNTLYLIIINIIILVGVLVIFFTIKKQVKLAQIKSDFVSNVSHELRTPLALISMFAETLELGRVKSVEKREEYYSIISRESLRLSKIVNKILSFSKLEAGKRIFNFNQNDLNATIEEILSTYSFHLINNGFKFDKEMNENIPKFKFDSEAISEAVINLIDNAIKYSTDKKYIKIKTDIVKDMATLEIIDKGIGISQEDQSKIFEKFYRVSTGLLHNTKGTGLGLSLVQHIISAHKGKIELKSKLGEGSSFKLLLPIKYSGES